MMVIINESHTTIWKKSLVDFYESVLANVCKICRIAKLTLCKYLNTYTIQIHLCQGV